MNTRSCELFGDLPVCPAVWLKQSWKWFLSNEDGVVSAESMKKASLLELDYRGLHGLRMLIVLAEFDPLLDEGAEFCEIVSKAGLQVQTVRALGSHAFATVFDESARAPIEAWFYQVLSPTK